MHCFQLNLYTAIPRGLDGVREAFIHDPRVCADYADWPAPLGCDQILATLLVEGPDEGDARSHVIYLLARSLLGSPYDLCLRTLQCIRYVLDLQVRFPRNQGVAEQVLHALGAHRAVTLHAEGSTAHVRPGTSVLNLVLDVLAGSGSAAIALASRIVQETADALETNVEVKVDAALPAARRTEATAGAV